MNKQAVKKKILAGFAWEGITKILVQSVTWVTTIIVARILAPEDYGIVAISGIFIGLLAVITDMGFMSALINKDEITQEQQDSAFWLTLLLSLALFALVYALAPALSSFYESDILVDIIRMSAFILPLTSLKVIPVTIAMRDMNFKYRALTDMMGQFVTSIASIIMAMNGFGVWTLIYSVLIGQAVVVVAYLPLMKKMPALTIKLKEMKEIIVFGTHLMLSQMLEFFTMRADIFIIGLFLPEKQVGYYSMGYQLSTIPLDKIGALFNRVAFPSVSRIKGDMEATKSLFINMHKYLLVIAFPVLVGLMVIADDLIIVLLTDKWAALVPIIQALCMLNLLRVSGMIMPYVMAGVGRSDYVLKYHVLSSILLPIAFLVGVQFGLHGVLVSWFVAYPFLYFFILRLLANIIGLQLKQFLFSVMPTVVSTLAMFASVALVKICLLGDDHVFNLIITIPLGAVSYVLAFYLLFKGEMAEIKSGIAELRN
ncbi:MAG: lipopolysaccharide biosynthesis protein [Gammaproteobacteria bacterium]|nr:lipopolysaccharide biosynthesis protein [Gammaproteobacteria bacterium]